MPGLSLQEQKKSFFNVYYHAVKPYSGADITIHVAAATMTRKIREMSILRFAAMTSQKRKERRRTSQRLKASYGQRAEKWNKKEYQAL